MSEQAQRGVVVVGAGPVGLITALGLAHHGIPVTVLEEDATLSGETKAGTVLTRTLEVLHRYGALEPVLRDALRLDEIGDIDRATNTPRRSVDLALLADDTRLPFAVNLPQSALEAALHQRLRELAPESVRFGHRVAGLEHDEGGATLRVEGPSGAYELPASHVLACDGGRSTIRSLLGVTVQGTTLDARYMLVDLTVDLDVGNPRDYPYLAYFSDPEEWMILVRQPHCWRFLYPLPPGAEEPGEEELKAKALRFIGAVDRIEVIGTNVYPVHVRIADRWRESSVFLMGDAAHLITPMWALGLNTGVLDASNLPWRLAWVLRGWADAALLEGYEHEQSSVATHGSAQMAEAARKRMGSEDAGDAAARQADAWADAMTRTLLGVRLDVDGTGSWSIASPMRPGELAAGDRIPDHALFDPTGGRVHVHDLVRDSFVALYFTDARRRPRIPVDSVQGIRHVVVSRWDAPHDSGLRGQALFDPGDRFRARLGIAEDAFVLLRPDGHVAAMGPWASGGQDAAEAYRRVVRPGGEG